MDIKFGIWDHLERRKGVPVKQQYEEKIRLLQEAERAGFYAYHIAEHHLTSLDLAPSPNVFLAALAQHTSTLHFGPMVYILPAYHPVRLVQEICMVDNMSGGRLEVGVGRGVRPVEHEWMETDPTETRARSEEVLKIITNAMTTGRLDYDGQFYHIEDAPLDMLPVQRPYPPIWYAGGAEFAGANHLNFLGHGLETVQRYWELWEDARVSPDRYNPQVEKPLVGVNHHMVLASTEEKAREIGARAWPAYIANFNATPLGPKGARTQSRMEDFVKEVLGDRLIVGTAQAARDFLERFLEGLGERPTFYFTGAFQWGDMSHDEAMESLQIFASEVMPKFQPVVAH